MNNRNLVVLTVLALLLFCGSSAQAGTIVLTFSGVGDENPVGGFYDGGAGGNLGISFSSNSLALVSILDGGSGFFQNAPGSDTVLFFQTGSGDVMNVAGGFTTGLSFFYATTMFPGSVTVWSGLNGTGTELASLSLPTTALCSSPSQPYCNWSPASLPFSATAESVDFGGTADFIVFDEITLGSTTPGGGGTPTPEPASLLLLGVGSLGLFGLRKKKAA